MPCAAGALRRAHFHLKGISERMGQFFLNAASRTRCFVFEFVSVSITRETGKGGSRFHVARFSTLPQHMRYHGGDAQKRRPFNFNLICKQNFNIFLPNFNVYQSVQDRLCPLTLPAPNNI